MILIFEKNKQIKEKNTMKREQTINSMPFEQSANKDWYLSMKPAAPKQTLEVKFNDGKSYKYLGTGQVKVGEPVMIGYGGATSYRMGNVVSAENGITIKRTHALKPLFTFSTDPGKAEIKKNIEGMNKIDEIKEVSSYFSSSDLSHEEAFQVVDYLIMGVLNAITVVAYPQLSGSNAVNSAKAFLAEMMPIPGIVFGKDFCDAYYGYYFDILRYADNAEVALTGHYPGWDEDLLKCEFWKSEKFKELKMSTAWNDNKTAYYLYFENGSDSIEEYFSKCEEFRSITNELIVRSALSILIRGGFLNLLKAALSVEMPIKGFYKELIDFADEIGSTECSDLLKSIDYENKVFKNVDMFIDKKEAKASKDFKIVDNVLDAYKGKDETVMIPDGVKIIGKRAFYNNQNIKKVIFPDSVTQVKTEAFKYCEELREVIFGKGLSSLGTGCFSNCSSLNSIDFSGTKVKTLPKELFMKCIDLKTIDLSETKITGIKEDVFYMSGLEKITLPLKLDSIDNKAFYKTKITEITIPESVKKITPGAFSLCEIKRIVFKGVDPIDFIASCLMPDCVIVCKAGSALMEMFENENAAAANYTFRSPHKLEAI